MIDNKILFEKAEKKIKEKINFYLNFLFVLTKENKEDLKEFLKQFHIQSISDYWKLEDILNNLKKIYEYQHKIIVENIKTNLNNSKFMKKYAKEWVQIKDLINIFETKAYLNGVKKRKKNN